MKTGRLEWNKLKQNQFNVYSSHSICIKNYCFFFPSGEIWISCLTLCWCLSQKYLSTDYFVFYKFLTI